MIILQAEIIGIFSKQGTEQNLKAKKCQALDKKNSAFGFIVLRLYLYINLLERFLTSLNTCHIRSNCQYLLVRIFQKNKAILFWELKGVGIQARNNTG